MESERNKFSFKESFFQGLTNLLVICLAILFFFVLYKSKEILSGLRWILSILMPIILGILVAYLVNPIVSFLEREIYSVLAAIKRLGEQKESKPGAKSIKLLEDTNQMVSSRVQELQNHLPIKLPAKEGGLHDKKPEEGKKRGFPARFLAILITFAIVSTAVYFLLYLVVPQIFFNIRRIFFALPWQMNNLMSRLENVVAGHQEIETWLNNMYTELQSFLGDWMKQDMVDQLSKVMTGVFGVVNATLDLVIGLIVAVYVLLSKERFILQFKKVIYAFLSDEMADNLLHILKESDRIFGGFFVGKLIDSFIIGVLCFIFATILDFPYVALISVIIGVTNIIPIFGPYIGAIPSAFLIFLANPKKGLLFIVFILILQQVDGNIIGPKILGESTGLSPFWVIFAIILGGGMFGVVGMIFGVPIFGVIYYLFRSLVNYRLNKKGKEIT